MNGVATARLGVLTLLALLTVREGLAQPAQPTPPKNLAKHSTLLGFTLGKSTLADVRQKLGASEIRKCSPGDSASNEVCYFSSANEPGTIVVFEAGFSGGWTQLSGYRILSGQRRPACHRQCTAITVASRDIRSGGGLQIGLSRSEVLALLGTPVRSNRDRLEFQWISRLPMTKEEIQKWTQGSTSPVRPYFDVVDTIDVTFAQSRVVELGVLHTVSY